MKEEFQIGKIYSGRVSRIKSKEEAERADLFLASSYIYCVALPNGAEVACHFSGKIEHSHLMPRVGDEVTIAVTRISPKNINGRIIKISSGRS